MIRFSVSLRTLHKVYRSALNILLEDELCCPYDCPMIICGCKRKRKLKHADQQGWDMYVYVSTVCTGKDEFTTECFHSKMIRKHTTGVLFPLVNMMSRYAPILKKCCYIFLMVIIIK